MGLGTPELIIIFIVALVVFGPRKLPELGRSLGKSLSEFKRASNELRSTLDDEIRLEEHRAQAAKTASAPVPPPAMPAPSPELVDPDPDGSEASSIPTSHPDEAVARTGKTA